MNKKNEKKINEVSENKEAIAELRLRRLCDDHAYERYGEIIPDQVRERLEYELKTISENKYCRNYLLAYEIARECRKRFAPQLSGGCAGASLTAFLLGITQTNPLPAHLYCPHC